MSLCASSVCTCSGCQKKVSDPLEAEDYFGEFILYSHCEIWELNSGSQACETNTFTG